MLNQNTGRTQNTRTQKVFEVQVGGQKVKVLANNRKQAEARGILQVLRTNPRHYCFFEIEVSAK